MKKEFNLSKKYNLKMMEIVYTFLFIYVFSIIGKLMNMNNKQIGLCLLLFGFFVFGLDVVRYYESKEKLK